MEKLYANPIVCLKITEELINYRHNDMLYTYSGTTLQKYFDCILFAATEAINIQSPNNSEIVLLFPEESTKKLAEFIETHNSLQTILEIIITLLKTQHISTKFLDVTQTYFNENIVVDISSALISVFKFVLKKVR